MISWEAYIRYKQANSIAPKSKKNRIEEALRPGLGRGEGTWPTTSYETENYVGVEAHRCKQLAQSRYAAAPWSAIELATSLS